MHGMLYINIIKELWKLDRIWILTKFQRSRVICLLLGLEIIVRLQVHVRPNPSKSCLNGSLSFLVVIRALETGQNLYTDKIIFKELKSLFKATITISIIRIYNVLKTSYFKSSSCFCHTGVFSKGGATNPLFQFFQVWSCFNSTGKARQPPIAKSAYHTTL